MADNGLLRIDRRVTLRWLAGAMASGQLAACGQGAKGLSWPEVAAVQARGVGKDPDLLNPVRPWPLTLTQAQRLTLARLVDLILPEDGPLPAASALGVPDFIDEWVSAPYPDQHRDRSLILPGLGWIDAEARTRAGRPFRDIAEPDAAALLDDIAFRDRVRPGLEKPAEFFARVRTLTLGAYYSTPEGWAEIGYMGNQPASGDYPGPDPASLAHIRGVIESMGLDYTPP